MSDCARCQELEREAERMAAALSGHIEWLREEAGPRHTCERPDEQCDGCIMHHNADLLDALLARPTTTEAGR